MISVDGRRSYGLIYMSNKKQYTFDSRDFFEKHFTFYHNGKYYRYTSQVNNDIELRPLPSATVRGVTIYNCGLMYRNPKDGKLDYTLVNQCDYKISVPAFMLNTFLPKAAKGWINDLQKFYQKNHKNL